MWDDDVVLDQARAALVGDSDVTLFSPSITPRIFHNPSSIFLVADQQNWVIHFSIMTIVKNSTDVKLPFVSIDWDWKWSQCGQCLFHCFCVIGKQWPGFFMVQELYGCGVAFALVLDCCVRVIFVEYHSTVSDEFHCPFWPWATAALATVFGVNAAIDQVLLRVIVQGLVFHRNHSFKGTCCWKCPAWTTHALVFNRSHDSFSSPVDRCWGWSQIWCCFDSINF